MVKRSITSCPLCEKTRMRRLYTCTDFYASGEKFDIYTCEACGFSFTQDAPAAHDIDKYYDTPQYISHSDTRKGMINSLYHIARKRMLARKASLVTKLTFRREGRLLDIGAGTGYFPAVMSQKGWTVDAIEKNGNARNFAKAVFDLDLMDEEALSHLPSGTYDVITLWHVLEHLEAINETWERLHELLADKGILIIAVPNTASFDAEKYRQDWAAYDVPRHLWHFNASTIQQFGAKHGLILAERHPMPFDAFYISMLSEKNMNHLFPFIRGMYTGVRAWLSSLIRKERSSSMIYVFRKKPQ